MVKFDITSKFELLDLVRLLRAEGCTHLTLGDVHMGFAEPTETKSAVPSPIERDIADIQIDGEARPGPQDILEDPDLYGGNVPTLPHFGIEEE